MDGLPSRPDSEAIGRVTAVVRAGHEGDEMTVRSHVGDPSPLVRVAVLGALVRLGVADAAEIETGFTDPSPKVRVRAIELAPILGVSPASMLDDPEPPVVEVACFACGELAWDTVADNAPIEALGRIATGHDDALCREAAAAALGAIGDPTGLEAVLAACDDRVTVRRRAVLALAAFDDPRADAVLTRSLEDKDWQVRQAAEDLLGVGRNLDGEPDPDAYADPQ